MLLKVSRNLRYIEIQIDQSRVMEIYLNSENVIFRPDVELRNTAALFGNGQNGTSG